MDSAVRSMLSKARKKEDKNFLLEAIDKLRCGRQLTNDQPDPFSSDLYVIAAEIALKIGEVKLVDECIKLYFVKTPPNNQFLCRAYFCQAQLNAPTSPKDEDKLECSVGFILKAIAFAKTNNRYHFLVYNASVLYWSLIRPFLRPNYRHLLAKSFHVVVKTLDEINDNDYEWRAQLMLALLECHIDAGRREDAVHISQSALQFTRSYVPHMSKEVFQVQIQYRLIDPAKVLAITKASPELHIYHRILRMRSATDMSISQIQSELEKILQSIMNEKDTEHKERGTSKTPTVPHLLPNERNGLLIDFVRTCGELNQPEMGELGLKEARNIPMEPRLGLQLDFLKCELTVKKMGDKAESYNKSHIDIRLKAINACEEHLMRSFRQQDENLMQIGCNVLWNLCLPILQNKLRQKVRKPLLLAVEILEQIDSLLILLRCQMHYEVAKIEEDEDQLQSALTHILKAIDLDDGNCYKIRLENSLKRLKLRALLYQIPDRAEDHAAMIIEQAEASTDNQTALKMRNYLKQAGCLLSSEAFNMAMDSEHTFLSSKASNSNVEKLVERVRRYDKGMKKIEMHRSRLEELDKEERVLLWADLSKTARKQEVWDVTRVAASFCLLYDDPGWFRHKNPDQQQSPSKSIDSNVSSRHATTPNVEPGVLSREQLQGMKSFSFNDDLLRVLAEVHFIYGEALVQLLQWEGVKLLETPHAPEDTKLRPKKYQDKPYKVAESLEWIEYSKWLNDTSKMAVSHFLRAAELGVELGESWVVCNAGIYLWNYTNHLLVSEKYSMLTQHLHPIYTSLQQVGHANETVFLCDLACALAQGYMQSHIPAAYYNPFAKVQRVATSKERKSKLGHVSQQNIKGKGKELILSYSRGRNNGRLSPWRRDISECNTLKCLSFKVITGRTYTSLQQVRHANETVFLCDLACALAQGYMQSHIPAAYYNPFAKVQRVATSKERKSKLGHVSQQNIKGKGLSSSISVDVVNDLKQALEVLDYALNVTNGTQKQNMVPISKRNKLIQVWVLCKGLLNQQLPKASAQDSEDPQAVMSRALSALEALSLQSRMVVEFSPVPNLAEVSSRKKMLSKDFGVKIQVIRLVESACWSDGLLHLQLWSKLSVIAYNSNEIPTSITCADMALRLGQQQCQTKSSKKNTKTDHNNALKQDMLFYASLMKGQCLVCTMNGRPEIRREALNCFIEACKFASKCSNYDFAMTAARHYWNTLLPLVSIPIERQLLTKPLKEVLKYIVDVSKDVPADKPERTDEQMDPTKREPSPVSGTTSSSPTKSNNLDADTTTSVAGTSVVDQQQQQQQPVVKPPTVSENLELTAALYSLLIQTYADRSAHLVAGSIFSRFNPKRNVIGGIPEEMIFKYVDVKIQGEFEDGLKVMDEAIKVMPRTHHRLLIFKHRVITLAKLKKPVQFDMGKFRGCDESLLSEMWLRVANHSIETSSQLSAYMNAIEALSLEENIYQKVDTLATFSEWLYVNEYPVSKALDQLSYAVSLLLNGSKKGQEAKLEFSTSFTSFKEDLKLLANISSIQQMDVLMRLYVMIAEMAGRHHDMYSQFNLAAAFLVQHMWKTSVSTAEKAVREGIKPGELSPSKPERSKRNSHNTCRERSAKSPLPTTTEAWATFTIPERFRDYFLIDPYGQYISQTSIKKPLLSAYYLEKLTANLHSIGFDHLSVYSMLLLRYMASDLLQSESLKLLYGLQSCELFQRLNITQADDLLHHLLDGPVLAEDEQEKSREQIELWDEKQRQVDIEKQRQGNQVKLVTSQLHINPFTSNKPSVGKIIYREVWARTAECLIRQGAYQEARLLLEEASLSAHAFNDIETLNMVSYNMALIAYHEKDWGKAMALLETADQMESTQKFWLKKIILRVDCLLKFSQEESTFQSHLSDDGFERAKDFLENSIVIVKQMSREKKNCTHLGPFITARLYSKLGLVMYTESKERRYKAIEDKNELLEDACQYLTTSFNILSESGYKRESIEMLFLLVEIRKKLALANINLDDVIKKKMLLETLEMAEQAVRNVTLAASEITQLSPREDVGNLFLPIQQDVITARIHCIDVMCAIMEVALKERKQKRLKEEQKRFIIRLIDNYVNEAPDLSDFDKKWTGVIASITQGAVSLSASIQMLCSKVPVLHVKAALHLGTLLSLIARYNSSDHFENWSTLQDYEQHKENMEEGEAVEEDDKPFDPIENLILEVQEYKYFMTQAVESLLTAIQLCLQHQYMKPLQQATAALIGCLGTRDQSLSVQLLALNQSSQAAMFAERVMKRAVLDSHTSEYAALLSKNTVLSQRLTNKNNFPLQSVASAMHHFECWRHLQISKSHFDIFKEIPFHFTYVILQHSIDKKYIYAGVMECSHGGGTTGKKKDKDTLSRTMISRQPTNEELLSKLLAMAEEVRNMRGGELLRIMYTDQQRERRKNLLGKTPAKDLAEENRIKDLESLRITQAFSTLITTLEAYLGAVLVDLEQVLCSDQQQHHVPENIVILADEHLLELPLEALSIFSKTGNKSLSRDFSLQMLHHRLKHGDQDSGSHSKMENRGATGKGKPDSKSSKDKDKKPTKPGNNEKEKKVVFINIRCDTLQEKCTFQDGDVKVQEKGTSQDVDIKNQVVKEFVIEKDNIIIDLAQLKYIIDPLKDIEGSTPLDEVFDDKIAIFKQKVAKWSGLRGSQEVASVKDMQTLLASSQAFLFLGYERMLGLIPPNHLASLNLKECMVAFVMDLVQSSGSFMRQGNLDARKSPNDLQLESPVQTAMLLSLCGVTTVCLNQWNTTSHENTEKLHKLFTGLFEMQNIGQVFRTIFPPMQQDDTDGRRSSQATRKKASTVEKMQEATPPQSPTIKTANATANATSDGEHSMLMERYNHVLYGLPNLATG